MRAICIFLLAVAALSAQEPQSTPANSQDSPVLTIKRTTQLVVETVVVTGKDGKPIEGLKAEDFIVAEDGKPQDITLCEFQKLQGLEDASPPPDAGGNQVIPAARTLISPEAAVNPRYRNRRLLVLYFDRSAMSIHDQVRALGAAQKFITTRMLPQDVVAVMMYSGGAVQVLSDFTDSRELLLKQLRTIMTGTTPDTDDDTNDDGGPATILDFGQDAGEFNIFNIDRQLAALQTAIQMLSVVREKKSLVYFAGGLRLNGINNQAQFRATINSAIRSNVSVYTVDARGLVAQSPLGDASSPSPNGIGIYTGATAQNTTTSLQQSQNALYALAADTGGKALLDSNDIMQGIIQAQKAIASYYVIGYHPSNSALDGKFRRINISVKGQSAKLDYRVGYYANKQFGRFTTADKERQLQEALMLGDPITELTIDMEVDYFRINRAEYFVPVSVRIPGNELALAHKGGAQHTTIDFIGEVRDQWNNTVTNVRDKIDIKLTETTVAELAKRPIEYQTGFTLLPGPYVIKFLARDVETGRIGTYLTKFVVPNLNKEEKRIPISSVVLASQRVNLRDALYTVAKNTSEGASPLVQDEQKLIPNVTRVFSKSRDMYVYLQAYALETTELQPFVAYVTFYHKQVKAFETPLLATTNGAEARSKAVPLKFNIDLSKLPPGKYDCQVSIIAPESRKAVFWQTPIMLVQ